MLANIENENFFLNLLKQGELRLSEQGEAFNTKTNRKIGYKNSKGYIAIGWKINRKVYHILLHRLMYLWFIGPLLNHEQVNHVDGNKQNNALSNFEKVTNSENAKHAWKIGLINGDYVVAKHGPIG